MKAPVSILTLLIFFTTSLRAQLETVASSNEVINGVAVSSSGRIFVCFPHLEGGEGMRIGEVKGKEIVAYPNENWNNWKNGEEVGTKIVRPNSLRIGPDGNLWIVDTGSPELGSDPLPGGAAKLVVVDILNNRVVRTIPLDNVAKKHSFFDDLRIYGNLIFLSDAAEPALIVLNLQTGEGSRLLEGDPSTIDHAPLFAERKRIRTANGKDLQIHVDQLEVSPDGKWLYFQPVSGPFSKIAVAELLSGNSSKLGDKVQRFFNSPTTGGTCIDKDGNIYLSDVDHSQIIRITPQGKSEVIMKDKRLAWCDAMWLDDQGYLYLPCAQINRLPAFQSGKSKVKLPILIYRLKTSSQPFRS